VPSDDANFDPPKFANWGHRNELCSVYGASCFLFIPTGLWLILLTYACTDGCYSGLPRYTFGTPLEGILYVIVGVTSLHGDVLYMGKKSYWHVADRMLAQALICLNALHIIVLTAANVELGVAGFACCVLPIASYHHSYLARDFDHYKACHTMWHVTASVNKGIIGYLGTLIPGIKADSLDNWPVYLPIAGVLAAEMAVCAHVWSLPKWDTPADAAKLVEQ
jgi:hypothetical protein